MRTRLGLFNAIGLAVVAVAAIAVGPIASAQARVERDGSSRAMERDFKRLMRR